MRTISWELNGLNMQGYYMSKKDKHRTLIIKATNKLFTTEDIFQGIKKLVGAKAQDIDGL